MNERGALAACLVATMLASARASEASAEATMQRGLAQFRAGQFASAVKTYNEALGGVDSTSYSMGLKKPEHHTAVALVGRALANAKASPRALQPLTDAVFDYQVALKLDPHVADSYARWAGGPGAAEVSDFETRRQQHIAAVAEFMTGQAAMANGAFLDAFAAYDKSLSTSPYDVTVWCRGFMHNQFGEFEKARADLSKAMRLDASDGKLASRYERARSSLALGDFDAAIVDLTTLIDASPHQRDWLEQIHRQSQTSYDALRQYDQFIRRSVFDWRPMDRASKSAGLRAVADFNMTLVAGMLNVPEHFFNRGLAFRGKGDWVRALADWTVAQELRPQLPLFWYAKALAHHQLGQSDDARRYRGIALRLDPGCPRVYESYAGPLGFGEIESLEGACLPSDRVSAPQTAEVAALLSAVRASNVDAARQATLAVRSLAARRAAATELVNLLDNASAGIRRAAAAALGQFPSEHVVSVPALIAAMDNRESEVLDAAIQALGDLGPTAWPAASYLGAIVEKEKGDPQRHAIEALGRIGPRSSGAFYLVRVLDDPQTRDLALQAMGRMGAESELAIPQVVKRLHDPSPRTRSLAVETLGDIGGKANGALPQIEPLAQDPDALVAACVAYAETRIGARNRPAAPVVALLSKLATVDRSESRERAIGMLGKLGSPAQIALPVIVAALSDESIPTRRAACEALGKLGPGVAAAEPALIKSTADENFDVRRAALLALDRVRGQP